MSEANYNVLQAESWRSIRPLIVEMDTNVTYPTSADYKIVVNL